MPNPATTAAQATQDERIPGLPVLPPNTDPATLTVPAYNPATDKTHQAPIGGPVPSTNAVPGGAKVVQYRDSRLYGVPAGALTLDRLNPLTIAPGTLATVDNPADSPLTVTAPPKQYVATVVAAGTAGAVLVPRYIGAATSDTVPITWQEVVTGAGIPAKLVVAASLLKAQGLLTAAAVPADTLGKCYAITGDWNATGTDTTVYVLGLTASAFASTGWVVDSTGAVQAVVVDVAAGTWVPVSSQEAEPITYADLLAELNANGAVRQKWFLITNRTKGAPDVTVYFTDPNDPSGWGDDHLAHLQPDGQSTRTRWAKYQLLSDEFLYDASLGGGVTAAELAVVATTIPSTTTRTADYTLALGDAGHVVPVASTSTVVVTVPTNAAVGFPLGTIVLVRQCDVGRVSVQAAPGVTIRSYDGLYCPGQWGEVGLQKIDLNTWLLKGGVS